MAHWLSLNISTAWLVKFGPRNYWFRFRKTSVTFGFTVDVSPEVLGDSCFCDPPLKPGLSLGLAHFWNYLALCTCSEHLILAWMDLQWNWFKALCISYLCCIWTELDHGIWLKDQEWITVEILIHLIPSFTASKTKCRQTSWFQRARQTTWWRLTFYHWLWVHLICLSFKATERVGVITTESSCPSLLSIQGWVRWPSCLSEPPSLSFIFFLLADALHYSG